MLATIDGNNSAIKDILIQEVDKFDYRFKRYGINYSVMIGFSTEPIDFAQFSSSIRKSDSFVLIAPNLCAIILDSVNNSNGIKAANKLLTSFQQTYFSKKIYSCVVTASNHESVKQMIDELYYLLTYAITNAIDDTLVDNSYLSKIYVQIDK
ncbi:hypothetical protein [Sulfurimonas sp.]|uniref:hypothetical protein n=1 Tax=Sulfurimonas sp. TaxID=2022749 RepID=UPI0025D0B8B8|nr:hypothetical protein [Sulfurimonas sp.]MDD5156474.1 hypothetical protein [Sulfurimonas sp.]